MFSFHKPKVYRSTQGCCICKAKSSSSRFTDSLKYENDFIECFQLSTPRKGEICNACVLLVKRYKRLPPGTRHWGHVVDARVGPGLKSMTKFKKRKEEQSQQKPTTNAKVVSNNNASQNSKTINLVSERFGKIFKKTKKKKTINAAALQKEENAITAFSDENSLPSSPISGHSDQEDIKNINEFATNIGLHEENHNDFVQYTNQLKQYKKYKRKDYHPSKNRGIIEASIIDKDFWTELKTCCGIVYENQMIGAVLLVDSNFNNHCVHHNNHNQTILNNIDNHTLKRSENIYDKIKTIEERITEHSQIAQISSALYNNNNNTKIGLSRQQSSSSSNFNKQKYLNSSINRPSIDQLPIKNIQHTELQYNASSSSSSTIPLIDNKNDLDIKPVYLQGISNNSKLMKLESNIHESKESSRSYNYLHKIKSDSSKIVKHSINKLTPAKFKSTDFNLVQNFVRLCTEKSSRNAQFLDKPAGENEVLGNKFNENSSDSGYEEILQEPNLKGRASSVRPVILANGIKLHVQPQNLVLAANLAGVAQMRQPAIINKKTENSTTNRLIKINHKDFIQNGVISSTTNLHVDQNNHLLSSTSSSSLIQAVVQPIIPGANSTTIGKSPLNQNSIMMNSNYFEQTTN